MLASVKIMLITAAESTERSLIPQAALAISHL
jgi:hypothetical protein